MTSPAHCMTLVPAESAGLLKQIKSNAADYAGRMEVPQAYAKATEEMIQHLEAERDRVQAETLAAWLKTPAGETAFPPQVGATGLHKLTQHFAASFQVGASWSSIVAARKEAAGVLGAPVEANTGVAKQVDEAIEAAVVIAARAIVARGPQEGVYAALVGLYNRQPNLNVRTSNSMAMQAYSTPVPLAYLASRLAGITPKSTVSEPTAGNGALLIAATPGRTLANELDPARAEQLRGQGFRVSELDAAISNVAGEGKQVDVVIANPPFGAVKDAAGRSVRYTAPSIEAPDGTYQTNEIDHAIVLRNLEAMKPGGRAVLIVGGVDAKTDAGKSEKYNSKAKREFYLSLYRKYNVVDHFTVSGDLYSRQGAGYPVDVIVIHGVGRSEMKVPAAAVPRVYDSWEEIGNDFSSSLGADAQSGDKRDLGKARANDHLHRASGADRGPDDDHAGRDGGGRAGPGEGVPGGQRSDAGNERADAGIRAEQPGVSDAGGRADGGQGGQPRGPNDTLAGGDGPEDSPGAVSQPGRHDAVGDYGKANTVFTASAAEAARALLKKKLANVNSGIDPEIIQAGITLAGYHIEAGARSFSAFARALVADIGEPVRPYLKSWYNAVRDYPGFDAKGMTPYDEVSGADAATIGAEPPAAPVSRPREQASEGQSNYDPASQLGSIGTLTPANMADTTRHALTELQDRVGSLDAFVADELGYERAELGAYLGAEQVDALALAIEQIRSGRGFIIGDQTGVGKGRVNAGVIRWAIRNGLVPVFVTEKPNLYGDMIRDLADIGSPEVKPFITNSDEKIPLDADAMRWYDEMERAKLDGEKAPARYGEFLTAPSAKKQTANMQAMVEANKLQDAQVIFTTYSQMDAPAGAMTPRREFLEHFTRGGVLILDEAHNAGGGEPQMKGGAPVLNRAAYVRRILAKARGAFYSSATYAKRPDVMDLYFRTGLTDSVGNPRDIGAVIADGGVPLQQVVAGMLSQAGQYVRRERSFQGIEYGTHTVSVDKRTANDLAGAMRSINGFSDHVSVVVKSIGDGLKAEGIAATGKAEGAGAESTNFTAVMHNLTSQFLLGLKVKPTVEMALASLKRGEKPVITLANTLETMINEFAETHAVGVGEPIDFSFKDLLLRYLEKTRWYREKKPFAKDSEVRYLTDADLGPAGAALFRSTQEYIEGHDWSAIPGSPIDYIRSELEKAGHKVGEITGRHGRIDYHGKTPTYAMRGENERSIAGRKRTIDKFNGGAIREGGRQLKGAIDVLILNQSGATGISLHASSKFGDQRKRFMLIAQPEGNIDTHMQMLGRVNRTGQVVPPAYAQLAADIPAEYRPAAILAKKMAMLNANTSAARSSNVTAKDTLDFMNEYGDEVIAEAMFNDQDLHREMGSPLQSNRAGDGYEDDGAARKVTGRVTLLSLEKQEELYRRIDQEYREFLTMKEAMGENALEAKLQELDALPVGDSLPLVEGSGTSIFTQGAEAQQYDVKRLGKPMTLDEVKAQVKANSVPQYAKDLREEFEDYKAQAMDSAENDRSRESAGKRLQATYDITADILRFAPGAPVDITDKHGQVFKGAVIKVERTGTPKNPAASGAWRMTIAMADAMRVLRVPFSRLTTGAELGGKIRIASADAQEVRDAFSQAHSFSREKRTIIEGNILSAFSRYRSGQITYFRDHTGEVKQGILMPRRFDAGKALAQQAKLLDTPEKALAFLQEAPGNTLSDADNGVQISLIQGGMVKMAVPGSQRAGGMWFLNRGLLGSIGTGFVSSGSAPKVAKFPTLYLPAALRAIYSPPLSQMLRGLKAGARMSEAPVNPAASKAADIESNIRAIFSAGRQFDKLVTVVQNLAELPEGVRQLAERGKRVQGFVLNGHIYLVADNIRPGAELGVFLHEAGVHMGMRRLIGAENMARLTARLKLWATKTDGSLEAAVARRALARAEASNSADTREELIAYFVEEAVSAGITPSLAKPNSVAGWLHRLVAWVKSAMARFGVNPAMARIDAQNLVDVAYGAAQMEILGEQGLPAAEDRPGFSRIMYSQANPYLRDVTPEQMDSLRSVGLVVDPETMRQKWDKLMANAAMKLRQGLVDQFAPIKDLSPLAYMKARMSKGSDGTLESALLFGIPRLVGNTFQIDMSQGGFIKRMSALQGEHERFFAWVATNRAKELKAKSTDSQARGARMIADAAGLEAQAKSLDHQAREMLQQAGDFAKAMMGNQHYQKENAKAAADLSRQASALRTKASGMAEAGKALQKVNLERLFTDEDIASLSTLNKGVMADGKNRAILYAQALKDLNEYSTAILDIAQARGIIDADSRTVWEQEFYVPFYRAMEDGSGGPSISSGLVNQHAFKTLKGSERKLNQDLVANTLQNWAHLLSAAAKNDAARATLTKAEELGIARAVPSGTKKAVQYLENGRAKSFLVSDPFLMTAISSLETPQLSGFEKSLSRFKRALTLGVTLNPAFKVRNLIRDSLQVIATGDLSYNVAGNIRQGWKATEEGSQTMADMIANGGVIRFGSMLEGNTAGHTHRLIENAIKDETILDTPEKTRAMLQKAWDWYQHIGDRSENINRTSLYLQQKAAGVDDLTANYNARNTMDFSMGGVWPAVRFLTQVVPFMNARMQGLYRLGAAAHEDPRRFAYVAGAATLASLALLAAYHDDEDWKKRELWDRQNYWWFKVGDLAYRIPKPFEIGALASVAEHTAELLTDDEMTGPRFLGALGQIASGQLAMDPTPQILKPMMDVYANKDAFTGRPIEPMGLEKLRPEDRFNDHTSEVAKFLGMIGLPSPTEAMQGKYAPLSPLQIDHLARGYLGWLATAAASVSDAAIRPMLDRPERPEAQLRDMFLAGNFMETLPAGSSRYVTQLYDQAKAIEEAYASYRAALQAHDTEKATDILESEGDKLRQYRAAEGAKRMLSMMNLEAKLVAASRDLTPEQKRQRLDSIAARKDAVAKTVQLR